MTQASIQKTSPTKVSKFELLPLNFSYHVDSGGDNNVNSNNKMDLLIEYFNSWYHIIFFIP